MGMIERAWNAASGSFCSHQTCHTFPKERVARFLLLMSKLIGKLCPTGAQPGELSGDPVTGIR